MAPELLYPTTFGGGGGSTTKSDIYSFAMTTYEVHQSHIPHDDHPHYCSFFRLSRGTFLTSKLKRSVRLRSRFSPALDRFSQRDGIFSRIFFRGVGVRSKANDGMYFSYVRHLKQQVKGLDGE
jgi:hypothetical protein